MMTVYDYAFARPSPALLDEGVIRYLCVVNNQTHPKVLFADELAALHQANKPVGLVYEHTPDPSTWDGAEALRQADALGFPHDRPIYFAADRAIPVAEWDDVATLLEATAVPVERRGLYAGAPLVQEMLERGLICWGWIAGALSWSMSPPYRVDRAVAMAPGAHLIQLVGTDVPGTDANSVLKADWGGWHPDHPTITTTPTEEDELMAVKDEINQHTDERVNTAAGDLAVTVANWSKAILASQKGLDESKVAAAVIAALHIDDLAAAVKALPAATVDELKKRL